MKNLISIFIIVSVLFSACQNDAATQEKTSAVSSKGVATSPNQAKELNISTAGSDPTQEAGQVVKNNPNLADKNSKIIDLEAMPQPQVKSASTAKKKVKKETPKESEIIITDNVTNKSTNLKGEEVQIEITQPKVIGGRVKGTPPAPVKKEVVIDPRPTTAPKAKVEDVKTGGLTITSEPKETPKPKAPAFSHDAWDKLLSSNVSASGKVNYKGFKANQAAFDAYLKSLVDNPIQSSWSRNKKMAYWINAYNAYTIKLIIDNYPVAKITDLHGGKPWDKKWIKLGGKTYSLNNIENDILRPQYKEPAIHFAVNCAAKSCPPILNRAWTAANLNSNFEKQAKAFINDSSFNKISGDKVELSKIFEWYGTDFGDLITYLNKYANTKINPNAKVSYMEYNWNLNE